MIVASDSMRSYFNKLEEGLKRAYSVASKARKLGFDPEDKVDIPIARNMAERVEGLISAVAPQLVGSGVTDRINELEKEYGPSDWRVALVIAEEVAKEKFCKFESRKEAVEIGVRVGFAYATGGIVAAPLEGFTELKIKKTRDNKDYLAPFYAGPIRGAGGTASTFSLLIVDYLRLKLGFAKYDPTEEEVNRYVSEVIDYNDRVTNLQYKPSEEEIKFMMSHIPIEVDGDPTEDIEVSNYKDLQRVSTNRIRGGMVLVIAEGLAQKAKKVWKQLKNWGKDFDEDFYSDWSWLEEFLELQKRIKAGLKGKTNKEGEGVKKEDKKNDKKGNEKDDKKDNKKEELLPNFTFIADLVAGRPVISYPLASGGFRLRYGRARTSGFSAASVHPSTMVVLFDYVAIGTQLKLERPGKAASISSCDTLEPPIVKLDDGSVEVLYSPLRAKQVRDRIEEVLYLGDILISYGDFLDRGHKLVPVGYCPEWFVLELRSALEKQGFIINKDLFLKLLFRKELSEDNILSVLDEKFLLLLRENNINVLSIIKLLNDPLRNKISFNDSFLLQKLFGIPLHPDFSFFWSQINKEGFKALLDAFLPSNPSQNPPQDDASQEKAQNRVVVEFGDLINERYNLFSVKKIVFKGVSSDSALKRTLELLGIPHLFVKKEFVVVEDDYASALFYSLGLSKVVFENPALLKKHIQTLKSLLNTLQVLDVINSQIKVRDKAGTFIGARMGRPEKAKMRKLTGSPHVLFPVGEEGGKRRSFQSAMDVGFVTADLPIYYCKHCGRNTIYPVCEVCGERTIRKFLCGDKEVFVDEQGNLINDPNLNPNVECDKKLKTFKKQRIDINHYINSALKKLGEKVLPDLVKGVRGTSNKDHIPENLAKGILRAKHDVYVNKDGTIRFDMTELPITHFRPREIGTSVEKLRELGYEFDIYGNKLESDDQILELKPQDVILPGKGFVEESADVVLFRVSKFIDDLLVKFYGLEPFYNLKTPQDLIGHLVIGLAPHTSAGILGRIIGFSQVQAILAHPLYHAAMRRDCDGDETCVMLLMDALLNFSRQYLPDKRGSRTMDSPLVLTSILIPSEVDDMIQKMETVFEYPLELYEGGLEFKNPWEVKVDRVADFLNTPRQYEGYGFSHDTTNINNGNLCSAYKTLPSMEDKLKGQMRIAELLRSVDVHDIAKLVIEKHLLKDIRGNLRKFSKQQFRCVNCNKKFRRPPLGGKCDVCGGRIIFTVSEGSIVKYLEPSLSLAEKYDLPTYLRQSLELTKRQIESIFGREKEKQVGLGRWF